MIGNEYIDLTLNPMALIQSTSTLLRHLYPSQTPSLQIQTQGLTNKLVKATYKDSTVLVRVNGSSSLIDRERELLNIGLIAEKGYCPGILAVCTNGIVYGYMDGKVFDVSDMKKRWEAVAQYLKQFHEVVESNFEADLFRTMASWIDLLDNNSRILGYGKKEFQIELDFLKAKLEELKSPIVFCHNDLTSGNLILQEDGGVRFIDFEYGGANYRGYDIANHFNEMCGVSGDWTMYPSKEFRLKWFKAYLDTDSDAGLEEMDREILGFSLASHLIWTVWALLQVQMSEIEFDYDSYAKNRMNEYLKRKRDYFNLP